MKKRVLMSLALMSFASYTFAEVASVPTTIERIMHLDDGHFGGCMIRLADNPVNYGANCRTWVSFSCTGDFMTKDNAYRMFDMSQMAFALEKPVRVWVNDAKKHNGYCVVERIDVAD